MIDGLLLLSLVGLMHATHSFSAEVKGGTELAFGFLLLAAYFSARICSRMGLPKLTGYLIAGVIGGPFVLDLVTREMTSSLSVVNGVATCILGLSAGAELDLVRIKPLLATLRAITVLGVLFAMVVLACVLFVLHPFLPMFDGTTLVQTLAICAVVAVALSAQSPAVVMALLAETRSEGSLSRLVLATVVVADLVVIVVYSIVAAVTGALVGGEVAIGETALAIVWELFGSMVFGVGIGILLAYYIRTVGRGTTMFAVLVCMVVAEIGGRVELDPLVV
ncbi:MAG: cation:proton antiporter, partial [Kofleriaceae bacterium]